MCNTISEEHDTPRVKFPVDFTPFLVLRIFQFSTRVNPLVICADDKGPSTLPVQKIYFGKSIKSAEVGRPAYELKT